MATYYQYKITQGTLDEIEKAMCNLGNMGFQMNAPGIVSIGLGKYHVTMVRTRTDAENTAYHGKGPWPLDAIKPPQPSPFPPNTGVEL